MRSWRHRQLQEVGGREVADLADGNSAGCGGVVNADLGAASLLQDAAKCSQRTATVTAFVCWFHRPCHWECCSGLFLHFCCVALAGLAPGVLAAAVAVPVAVALLAAALAAWLCRRRRRKKRAAAAAARAPLGPKDMEAGRHHSTDLGGFRDHQHPSDDDRDRVSCSCCLHFAVVWMSSVLTSPLSSCVVRQQCACIVLMHVACMLTFPLLCPAGAAAVYCGWFGRAGQHVYQQQRHVVIQHGGPPGNRSACPVWLLTFCTLPRSAALPRLQWWRRQWQHPIRPQHASCCCCLICYHLPGWCCSHYCSIWAVHRQAQHVERSIARSCDHHGQHRPHIHAQ